MMTISVLLADGSRVSFPESVSFPASRSSMLFSFRISPDRLLVSLPLLLYYHTFYIGLDFLIALARYFWALAYACITTPNHFTTNVAPLHSPSYTTHTFPAHNDLLKNRFSPIDWLISHLIPQNCMCMYDMRTRDSPHFPFSVWSPGQS